MNVQREFYEVTQGKVPRTPWGLELAADLISLVGWSALIAWRWLS